MSLEHGDDYVDPYDWTDPAVEPRPSSVVFLPILEKLNTVSRKPLYILRDTLAAFPYQNKITKSLLAEVQAKLGNDISKPTMFAIAGDMAAGKSSVINSILSIGTIARKGNSGDSCTWVVQKFRKPFPDQGSAFEARVFLFSPEEIRTIITSLFVKYYRAMNQDKQEGDSNDTEDVKSENFNDTSTVLEAFMDLFADHQEFQDESEARDFLSQATCEQDHSILGQLVQWAVEVLDDWTEGNDFVTVGSSDLDSLTHALQPYTHQLPGQRGRDVCIWSAVSVVEFGLKHPLLEEDIILVDAPGLSDSNDVRANNARKHLRQCTHQITIADISRAKNDKSLREELAQSYALRGSAGTMAVLTRGDSIDDSTEVSGSQEEMMMQKQLYHELKALRDKRAELSKKKRKASRDEQFDINADIREIDLDTSAKENEWRTCRIRMRNRSVVEGLQQQYRILTGDAKQLNAFAVGNQIYSIHQAGYYDRNAPALSVTDTGVPAVRQKIFALPAEGKRNDSMHFAANTVPGLFSFFDLFCSKTTLANKTEIEQILRELLDLLPGHLISCKQKLMELVKLKILDCMECDEAQWVSEAKKLCRAWAKHAKTNLIIIKKNGCRKASKRYPEEVDWNRSLLEIPIYKDKMDDYFTNIMAEMTPIFRELESNIGKLLDGTKQKIRGESKLKVMGVESFLDTFKYERPNIHRCIEDRIRTTRRATTVILQDATVPSNDCYLTEAMAPVYAQVLQTKGRGAPEKRMETFEKSVATMSGIMLQVRDRVKDKFENQFDEQLGAVEEAIKSIFNSIDSKFQVLCDETVVTDEEEKRKELELRQKLSEQLATAREVYNTEVEAAVEKVSNYKD